jgi:hypothetical protein
VNQLAAFEVRDGTFAMIRDGQYELSTAAKTIYWFLLYHGIWQPGHTWFGHADIRVTAVNEIHTATGWSRRAIQRALAELEDKEFIQKIPRHVGQAQLSNGIKFRHPSDWCLSCHVRGSHRCVLRPAG